MDLNLIGVVNKLSYGIVLRNVLKALMERNHRVALYPISPQAEFEPSELPYLQKAIANGQFFEHSADCVRIWHQNDMAQSVGHGRKIGWPIFELNKFSKLELHHLRYCDMLFVCSQWAKQVCIDNDIEDYAKICVVPLGVDQSVFKVKENNQRPDVFTIHNIGKIEIRKGHDVIPAILNKAFRKDDKFKLKMMWRNPIVENENVMGNAKIVEWEDYYTKELDGRVEFCPQVDLNSDVAAFLNASHLGLYPAKAEGWNLSLLESMACGCHVVATNYSAHTEYCTDLNASLVTPEGMEPALDDVFFDGKTGEWAAIGDKEIDEFAEHVRFKYDIWKKGDWDENVEGLRTAKQFSWHNTVRKMEEHINE